MKFKYNIISLFIFATLTTNCSKKETAVENPDNTTEQQDHREETQTMASLTEEQISAVGIILGNIEMKELTSTIKANGLLRVPNNNKAAVTSLYGGIIKTLPIQVGSFVKKRTGNCNDCQPRIHTASGRLSHGKQPDGLCRTGIPQTKRALRQ